MNKLFLPYFSNSLVSWLAMLRGRLTLCDNSVNMQCLCLTQCLLVQLQMSVVALEITILSQACKTGSDQTELYPKKFKYHRRAHLM